MANTAKAAGAKRKAGPFVYGGVVRGRGQTQKDVKYEGRPDYVYENTQTDDKLSPQFAGKCTKLQIDDMRFADGKELINAICIPAADRSYFCAPSPRSKPWQETDGLRAKSWPCQSEPRLWANSLAVPRIRARAERNSSCAWAS